MLPVHTVAGGVLHCTHTTSAVLQAVSYKWLARERSLPANLAKQLLFAFAEAHRGKVAATYLLAGWVKDGAEGGEARHVVKLVPAACLAQRRAELDRVTDVHVHNVQPTQPKARRCPMPVTAELELCKRHVQLAKCACGIRAAILHTLSFHLLNCVAALARSQGGSVAVLHA